MTYRDPVIPHLQNLVDTHQLIVVPKCKMMDKISCPQAQRKVITLCEEIELLDRLARGQSAASAGLHYDINELTVR